MFYSSVLCSKMEVGERLGVMSQTPTNPVGSTAEALSSAAPMPIGGHNEKTT